MPIQCDLCQRWFHGICEKLKRLDWSTLGKSTLNWYCSICKFDIFPFNKLDNDELAEYVTGISSELDILRKKCQFLDKSVKHNKLQQHAKESCYITRDQLTSKSKDILQSFSLIQFNCRSVKKNFDNIDNLLHSTGSIFSVVALSESWMSTSHGDSFKLYKFPGYSVYNVNREHKKGGGTALYIKSDIEHTYASELSYSVDECFEVVTVEINVKHGQNLVVACLYKPPNVRMNIFIHNFTAYLNKLKNKKVFICGDFNIDLLKSESDYDTGHFLDTLFSYGQYPLIDRPTRIQERSCTAIDNIYTNIITNEIASNILIDDTTDHLPVLCIYNQDDIKHVTVSKTVKKRRVNEKNITSLINMLKDVNWENVYDTDDVNIANKNFTSKLVECYDKCCPFTETRVRIKNNKPWLTKGFINACRKKNYLYKCSLHSSDSQSKERYIRYKNKLTSVLRAAEKQYYNNKLAECKKDIKSTWSVLNNLVGRKKRKTYTM